MNLTRASALATFAVVHLVESKESRLQGKEIAAALETPTDYLLKILQGLVRARLLTSLRGPNGGFELSRDPDEITLLEIVEAIDGPVLGNPRIPPVAGKQKARSVVETAFQETSNFAIALLSRTRISDLVEKPARARPRIVRKSS